MKIQYISDIHMEFFTPKIYNLFLSKLKPQADILILAGDICYPNSRYKEFLDFCSKNWKQTYYVAGNHEYYENGSLEKTNKLLKEFQISNVKFLNNEVDYYEDYKIIGTTLWSYIPKDNQNQAKQKLNDFVKIDFNPEKYNEEHVKCIGFLVQQLDDDIKTIVISHHLPSYKLIHPCYEKSEINYCFASGLEGLFYNKKNIKAWFYGHSHKSNDKKIFDVNFYSNPIGYINENQNFQINKMIEL